MSNETAGAAGGIPVIHGREDVNPVLPVPPSGASPAETAEHRGKAVRERDSKPVEQRPRSRGALGLVSHR